MEIFKDIVYALIALVLLLASPIIFLITLVFIILFTQYIVRIQDPFLNVFDQIIMGLKYKATRNR